ncbi:poly-gamma-glutamate biosynthesis protein PgsC/CapC [Planctobacterium marinum]|uniref:Capsule biosynthesis CapC n=1 Tax=Planctobacterium marinum TaxID=1631968 RepID=A0AA48HGJ1_9ALTE|nr:hypothetical protein MACH26_04350 [Planctobacterium marinum]
MPDFLQLSLFPAGALQSSVITTVWVGVCVVVFLNARFGTTLAGLVVPGYLVPLFFVKPASAIVVLAEAYITYGLAWLLANKLLVRFGYSEMFGRDRFFALILLSVLVRICLDFFLIPLLIASSGDLFAQYDLQNNLQSFGLIIVALIANQMWMGGVVKGSKALFLYLGLTFIIINWLLIPLTNFNIGGLNYMYEDLATSLLSSPKAYIILLTTAFIASRMNLQFGWEFNGILIPALLALQWYQPEKLLFTFVEAAVILFLGIMALRTPLLRGITFEGGRLLLLFFNIGFVYKILLGFALIEYLPTAKISDYFGFGYIVSTLIAVKVYQKQIALKMAVSTVFTSFVGISLATIAGFALTFVGDKSPAIENVSDLRSAVLSQQSVQEIYAEIRPVSFFSEVKPTEVDEQERQMFVQLLNALKHASPENISALLPTLEEQAEQSDIDIWLLGAKQLVLHKEGIGFYAINLQPESELVIEVTRARAELGAATFGLALFQKTHANALFIDLSYQLQNSGEYLFDSDLDGGFFQAAHETFSQHNVLQIRGALKITEQRKRLNREQDTDTSMLTVLRTLPEALPVGLLNNVVSDLNIQWRSQGNSPQWQHDKFGIAELRLNNREMRSALARIEVYQSTSGDAQVDHVEGYLISWLLERKQFIAQKGSNDFVKPQENQLLFWYQDILIPLMSWLSTFEQQGWTEQSRNELQRLNWQAASVGYEFRLLEQPLTQKQFLILEEQHLKADLDNRKNWASLVINLNANSNYLVMVPNPFYDRTSFEFGAALFNKLQSRFLLLSGTHPWANTDGSSNVTMAGNKHSLFHTMFMAISKEFDSRSPTPVLIRGFSFQESRPFPEELAMVSLWRNINQYNAGPETDKLMAELQDLGLSYRFVNGDFVTSPYYQSTSQQIDYINYLKQEQFITLWISPLVRDSFKATDAIKVEEQHARLLGLPVYRRDIRSFAIQTQGAYPNAIELHRYLQSYATNRNIHSLANAISLYQQGSLVYLLDSSSLQQFLLLLDDQENLIAAINLNSLNQRKLSTAKPEAVNQFVNARYLWLVPEGIVESSKP